MDRAFRLLCIAVGTKSFFPKWRSVGPEPGRTLFFRIERTGRPAAVRPVSIPFFGSLSTSLTLPGFVPTGKHVCGPLSFIIRCNLHRLAFARPPKASIGSFVVYPPAPAPGRTPPRATRSRVPRSQRLRRRRFAPPLRPPDVFVSRRLPLQTASHPRVGTGNVPRPRLRVGLAIPPPTPTPAHGTHCPPMAAFAASAFGASACGAISVPPDFSGPLPSVHSPLHLFDSALLFSARCLPAKSTS